MTYVEKDLTAKNFEHANNHPEFLKRREKETKLVATSPEYLETLFKKDGIRIEQTYLSNPYDEFSLRVRKTETPTGFEYTGTLKDRGAVVDGARDRLEINVPISETAYEFYKSQPQFPEVKKIRSTIEGTNEVVIDFFEDTDLQIVEVENSDPSERTALTKLVQDYAHGTLVEKTGDVSLDNEAIAHHLAGNEFLQAPESLDHFVARVTEEMVAQYVTGKNRVVVTLPGMSGSGKTTVTRGIQERIVASLGETYLPHIISTDDYHFGKQKLEETYGAPWTEWDDPRTYNTAELAHDLELVSRGSTIIRRHFDFESEEPVFDEEVTLHSPFVLIEGLYAGSKDLANVRDLQFELPTGIATSIGRDVRRLLIENRANRVFPTPESRLQYQLETATPLYLSQERVVRNAFSASSRILAERAFLLKQLNN